MRVWGFISLLCVGSISWAAPDTIPVVQIKKVELSENSETLSYPARVESRVSGAILAEIEGVVREVAILGSHVKKGQVLFKIQQLDPVYQYAPAKIVAPRQRRGQ